MKKKQSLQLLLATSAALFALACSDSSSSADIDEGSSSSAEAESSSSSTEESAGKLYVFGSDYTSGELRFVEDGKLSEEKATFNQDTKIVAVGGELFALERYGADNLALLDSAMGVVWQVALDDAGNPSDAVKIDDSKIWVALEGAPKLLQVSVKDGKTLKTVETSDFTTEGATSPNLVDLEVSGDTLFALFQRYVYDAETWTTSFPNGLLALYRLDDGELLDTVSLASQNPTAMAFADGNLYVAFQGEYNDSYGTDADDKRGIEKVDLEELESELVVSGEKLGGGVYAFAVDAENGIAYAAVYKAYGDVPLAKIDLASAKVSFVEGVSDAEGSLCFADGVLYVGDRTYGSESVYVYDGADVSKVENADGALAPYSIAFVR